MIPMVSTVMGAQQFFSIEHLLRQAPQNRITSNFRKNGEINSFYFRGAMHVNISKYKEECETRLARNFGESKFGRWDSGNKDIIGRTKFLQECKQTKRCWPT